MPTERIIVECQVCGEKTEGSRTPEGLRIPIACNCRGVIAIVHLFAEAKESPEGQLRP